MPYYDTLGRYINPFYLDVHPDVRAEMEMRAALVASDFRSANTKSIEWPYQKMPWAHIISVDFPNIKLGFSKEQLDGRNSDEQGDLILYTKERNVPKIPLLTGVEISNMGQRGSLLKGKFSFTYFPELTIDGFDLEELQGALFTPGREVQISFGWSSYAENPWVNKLEFKGLIYGFNWTVQPNLSISADVEIVSATTLALGLSGDQSVIESDQSDIVKVEGWNTELKGLNLLTVIKKDLAINTASLEQSGQIEYYPRSKTSEKLLDYFGIRMPTSEFEEVQNIVINDYDYDPNNWDGGGTPYGADTGGQEQDGEEDILETIKKKGKEFYDKIWNESGGQEFSDPSSRWNTARDWRTRWEIIKEYYNNPWVRDVVNAVPLPLLTPASILRKALTDADTYIERTTIDLGEVEYSGPNKGLSKTFEFQIVANNEELWAIQPFDSNSDRLSQSQPDAYCFDVQIENNTGKLVSPVDIDGDGQADQWRIKDPRPSNVPSTDKVTIKWRPQRSIVTQGQVTNNIGEYEAKITLVQVKYEPVTVSTSDYAVAVKDPKTGKMLQRGERFTGLYENKAKSRLIREITVKARATVKRTTGDGTVNDIDMNIDPFLNLQEAGSDAFGDIVVDILQDNGTFKKVDFQTQNKKAAYTYNVNKTYKLKINTLFGFDVDDKAYNQYRNARVIGGNDEFSSQKPKLGLGTKQYGKDFQEKAYVELTFTPKTEGVKTYYLRVDVVKYPPGGSMPLDNGAITTAEMRIRVGVGPNIRPASEDEIRKEDKEKSEQYDKGKREFDDTVDKKDKDQQSPQPTTDNPTDTAETEEPISATNESEVKVQTIEKTFWYVRLGSLVEFANKIIENYEADPKNKGFANNLFRIQAYNNEAEYNKHVKSAYPIDVFFPDKEMGRYGQFCPFDKDGIYPQGNQMLRKFQRRKDDGTYHEVLENDVINIGEILIGVDYISTTYEAYLAEGGQNISMKNITKFFDEIVKFISTATGEIYQLTTILFEEPEKLIPRSGYNQALENVKLRGGSRIEMADIFSYDVTNKRSKAIVSIEDTNLAAKVIKEGSVEPFKFDATMVRPMLKNVQVVSKPSKEMAAAAYIAARGQGSIERGGSGQGLQSLEVSMNLRGFQNEEEYKKEVEKVRGELEKDLDVLGKSGWNSDWSEMIRGNLIKLKRLTIEPHDQTTGLGTSWLNRAIYPIEFSLTLDGINGFKFGDVISTSLIPKHYNVDWKVVFTVIKVVHKVTTSTWETTLYTAARLSADGNYASKVNTAYVR